MLLLAKMTVTKRSAQKYNRVCGKTDGVAAGTRELSNPAEPLVYRHAV